MALSTVAAQQALIAFQRFGLGAKPGGPAHIGKDPKGALRAVVQTHNVALIDNPDLPSYRKACSLSQRGHAFEVREQELNARVDKHRSARIGFVERLVIFWSNHFSMNVYKADAVAGTIGQWERDVVRRHVLGNFRDMLNGTLAHPAMLAYLDNADSIGPNSKMGLQWGAGYNENLARELMELHTLGSGGGYTEQDVTALANILTGWSYVRQWEADYHENGGTDDNRGQFLYRSHWHEPGPITLMGKKYPPLGQKQAELVLKELATHPATAEHIAFKLVRHFITDEPTAAMVEPLKEKFLKTDGDLKAVALALLDLPESWSTPFLKFRTPYEFTIAQYRGLGARYKKNESWIFSEPLNALHQMAWESPSPEGYADETPKWLNPDAARIRLDVAQLVNWALIGDFHGNIVDLADSLFDSALSHATKQRLRSVEDKTDALTILFTCPEFQRR
jgi:uncharacterized protein (DUF1800 family)